MWNLWTPRTRISRFTLDEPAGTADAAGDWEETGGAMRVLVGGAAGRAGPEGYHHHQVAAGRCAACGDAQGVPARPCAPSVARFQLTDAGRGGRGRTRDPGRQSARASAQVRARMSSGR